MFHALFLFLVMIGQMDTNTKFEEIQRGVEFLRGHIISQCCAVRLLSTSMPNFMLIALTQKMLLAKIISPAGPLWD